MTIPIYAQQTSCRIPHLVVVILATILLGGCRLYGGYGTVEATRDAIEAETAGASEELDEAARTLRSLRSAAEGDARVAPIVAEFTVVYDLHVQLVAEYEADLEESISTDSYRALSRRLGAMLTEQRQIRHAYEALGEAAAVLVDADRVPDISVPERMYGVYPAVYYAWWHAERMNAVHQVVRSAG